MIAAPFVSTLALALATTGASPADGVDCKLVLSLDYGFEDRWAHTPAEVGPQISTVSQVVRKQYFTAFTFLTGYAVEASGEARVEGDVRVTKPDGSTWFERKGLEILNGRVAEPANVMLSISNLRVCFEPGDPFGEYQFTVVVRDLVGKVSASASGSIRLTPFPTDVRFGGKEDVVDWLQTYCRAPRPNEAVEAFLVLAREGHLSAGPLATRARAFFGEVFEHNAHLFPQLFARHPKEGKAAREAILRHVAWSKHDASGFLAQRDPEERDAHARMSAERRPEPFAEIVTDPAQVESLWGIFLASGSYAPLLAIARVLEEPDEVAVRKVAAGDIEAVRRAARRALAADIPAHALVEVYLRWIGVNEDLAEPAPGEIEAILQKK